MIHPRCSSLLHFIPIRRTRSWTRSATKNPSSEHFSLFRRLPSEKPLSASFVPLDADFFDPEWMFGDAVANGFDLVIGNPPYIQIQKLNKEQKDQLSAQIFETYAATADLYCLFYERGIQLLRDDGHLCYITSNKWMRAGYGEKLRRYLVSGFDTYAVMDFGMAQNFSAATTYTNVLLGAKRPPSSSLRACYAKDTRPAMQDPALYFQQHAVDLPTPSKDPWVILSPERQQLKTLVESQGIPLGTWDINIYRGVLTGFNDAFYITQEQRDAFVAADPRCAEHLVPLLRGRFVERYATRWDGTWMINRDHHTRHLARHRFFFQPSSPCSPSRIRHRLSQSRFFQLACTHISHRQSFASFDQYGRELVTYLGGLSEVGRCESVGGEVEITHRLTDRVFRVNAKLSPEGEQEDFLVHLEFESSYKTGMGHRLGTYGWGLCGRENLPVMHIVWYVSEKAPSHWPVGEWQREREEEMWLGGRLVGLVSWREIWFSGKYNAEDFVKEAPAYLLPFAALMEGAERPFI
ncbi:Eco57I restriction-modification methylase domain-containing protein, partial [Myxococcota bacterium]|nr:Eco57I restriction-modification methylase domain-containing protein [Myxococcota bacterium]